MTQPSLRADRLSFAHSSSVPLFTGAEFHLSPGWTGLVGENGAGKSTLLRLVAGELSPDEGHVHVEPEGARVVLCPQAVEAIDAAILALAESSDPPARRLVGQLRLDAGALDRWETLSPGERKRWQIGAALASEADVLLLDEPTNHLDAAGRSQLAAALARFRGVGVVVSHDRALLEDLTTATLRIHRGRAELYRGAYEAARREWEAEAQQRIDSHHRLRDEQREVERRLADARRDQAAAAARLSASARMKDKNDHDARGILAKNRVAFAEKRIGRTVGVLRRELDRAAEETSSVMIEKSVGRSVFVDWVRAPSPWLFQLDVPEVRAGEARVLGETHVGVGREDRIHLEGDNGAGKTTLLRALLAASRVPREKILHLPQDLTAAEERALLAEVRALPPAERGRVLSLVAALGVLPDRLLGSAAPSPGEARKLAMAIGLGRHAWALVLDEPTNHLDLPSIERLELALGEYPGALLLVTHDRRFAERCTRTRWRVAEGKVGVSREERSA